MGNLRGAIVQFDFQPAFYSRSGATSLEEPVLLKQNKSGLSNPEFFSLTQVKKLRETIREEYLKYIKKIVREIIVFCLKKDVQLLVFPEYSVPIEVLPIISQEAMHLTVIAGTHSVIVTENSQQIYQQIFETWFNPSNHIGEIICPIYNDGSWSIVSKDLLSSWEQDKKRGKEFSKILSIKDSNNEFVDLEVFICIEALSPNTPIKIKRGIIAIPSYSPSIGPFLNTAEQNLLAELPTFFANTSIYGNSVIFAQFPERSTPWFYEGNNTIPIPQNDSGLVIVDINLDRQVKTRGTISTSTNAQVVSYLPIVFNKHSGQTQKFFKDIQKINNQEDLNHLCNRYHSVNDITTSKILEFKIKLYQQIINQGLLDSDLSFLSESILIDDFGIDAYRSKWSLQAIDVLKNYIGSVSNDIEKSLFKVLSNITDNKPDTGIPFSFTSIIENQGSQASQAEYLENRNKVIDTLHESYNNTNISLIVLQGLRGAGKSHIINYFLTIYAPDLERKYIYTTEGTGFPRFISEFAKSIGINLDASYIDKLSIQDLKLEIIELYSVFDNKSGATLVFEDIDFMLDRGGVFRDSRFYTFLDTFIKRNILSNNKIFITSQRVIKGNFMNNPSVMDLRLEKMEDSFIKRIIEHTYRKTKPEIKGKPFDLPQKLVNKLHGHPYAARLVGKLLHTYPPEVILKDVAIFERFQNDLIRQLIRLTQLEENEQQFIQYISVFRIPVTIDAYLILDNIEENYKIIEQFINEFYIEFNGSSYLLHPFLARYFYGQMDEITRIHNHKYAAEYYEELINSTTEVRPDWIGEALYHFASSFELEKGRSFLATYREELHPVSKAQFQRRNFEKAKEICELQIEIDDTDFNAHFRLSLCLIELGAKNKDDNLIKKAKHHYDIAYKLRNDAWWIHLAYAFRLITKIKALDEAESAIQFALEINDQDPSCWQHLGVLRDFQKQYSDAAKCYEKALKLKEDHFESLRSYGRNRQLIGDNDSAWDYFNKAFKMRPKDFILNKWMGELREEFNYEVVESSINDTQNDVYYSIEDEEDDVAFG